MPDYRFKVKGHPIGFVLESESQDTAMAEFEALCINGNSGAHGFKKDDVLSIKVVENEREPHYVGGVKVL